MARCVRSGLDVGLRPMAEGWELSDAQGVDLSEMAPPSPVRAAPTASPASTRPVGEAGFGPEHQWVDTRHSPGAALDRLRWHCLLDPRPGLICGPRLGARLVSLPWWFLDLDRRAAQLALHESAYPSLSQTDHNDGWADSTAADCSRVPSRSRTQPQASIFTLLRPSVDFVHRWTGPEAVSGS